MHTYTLNLAFPLILGFLVLLAVGTIPFTAIWVAAAIALSHVNVKMTWTR